VDGKSNEISAIAEILDLLDIKGAVITIDTCLKGGTSAMGSQRTIVQKLIPGEAD
jgi:predicted transposase YbfD/YdcC